MDYIWPEMTAKKLINTESWPWSLLLVGIMAMIFVAGGCDEEVMWIRQPWCLLHFGGTLRQASGFQNHSMVEGYRPAGSHSAPTADLQAACLRELRHRRSEGEGKKFSIYFYLSRFCRLLIGWTDGFCKAVIIVSERCNQDMYYLIYLFWIQ